MGADTDLVSRAPNAPLQHIAHAQLTPDLFRIDGPVPIRERGVARDHEHILDPRQIDREILGDSIREILLLAVIAEVCKGQNND